MLSSTSLAATGLALSVLLLSVTATPLQARGTSFEVTCGDASDPSSAGLGMYCTNPAISVTCSADGKLTSNVDGRNPAAFEQCSVCTCKQVASLVQNAPPPPPPHAKPSSVPPVPMPSNLVPKCTGTIMDSPNAPRSANPPTNQDWCTRPQVEAVCYPVSGLHVLGSDEYNVCATACKC